MRRLGLYPIVDSSQWLARLLPLGVKCIQLRIKTLEGQALRTELEQGIALARKYQAMLFINDHWELALSLGAPGVHLGQDDLPAADLRAIHQSGISLGISTHNEEELAIAEAARPSYIALGPIYPSKTKDLPVQGLANLKRWRQLTSRPLVAIGGITLARIPEVLATGVDGIAMITSITQAKDPIETTKQLLAAVTHD